MKTVSFYYAPSREFGEVNSALYETRGWYQVRIRLQRRARNKSLLLTRPSARRSRSWEPRPARTFFRRSHARDLGL